MATTQAHQMSGVDQANDAVNYKSFVKTWAYMKFINQPHKMILLSTGNQAMKTASCAHQYVLRILGIHPIPEKNVVYFECSEDYQHRNFGYAFLPEDMKCPDCGADIILHERTSRVFRFASETLPNEKTTVSGGGESAEVKNTQYPEFKKWLPKFLIKKDITHRNTSMIIMDPLSGMNFNGLEYKGRDIVIDFTSYAQDSKGAGVQRMSTWEDEEPPIDFHEEQLPRLLAENGDLIMSLTPANRQSWTYDDIFEKAEKYIRTQIICDYMTTKHDKVERIEHTELKTDICVIQAATDDNPTLKPEAIESLFGKLDDPDAISIRRYGLHKQVKGRIFKSFDYRVHYIDPEPYFPDCRMFPSWSHAQMIDYHEHNPWAVVFISMSPQNEAFIWWEWAPSPEKYMNDQIAERIARQNGPAHRFSISLMDPLGAKKQTNTNKSVIDDFNNYFREASGRNVCRHARWESWDTKTTVGRDAVRKRLMNSKRVKRPFNNKIVEHGLELYLPTLWIWNNCKEVAKSLRQWRLEEWKSVRELVAKDRKETPQQKFSHFPTAIEAIFKDRRFRARSPVVSLAGGQRKKTYFAGREGRPSTRRRMRHAG